MQKVIKISVYLIFVLMIFSAIVLPITEKMNTVTVCFPSSCFRVEVARTPTHQERGLMFRYSLSENQGMLFVFDNSGDYPFWMHNTFIALDIIWLDETKKVVFMEENAQPCPAQGDCPDIDPLQNAKYVLEVNAGTAEKIGLKVGDVIQISY